jgi:uncharacterized coiled-coil DUF342 family protein
MFTRKEGTKMDDQEAMSDAIWAEIKRLRNEVSEMRSEIIELRNEVTTLENQKNVGSQRSAEFVEVD